MKEEKDLGADAAAVAFAGSSAIGLPASILDAFDAQFGTDGPERNSDSVGRAAGCDDCGTSVAIRAEHRRFVERVIRAFLMCGPVNAIAIEMETYADDIHSEYDRETAKRLYRWAADLRVIETQSGNGNQAAPLSSGSVPSAAPK